MLHFSIIIFVVFALMTVTCQLAWVYFDARSRNLKPSLMMLLSIGGNNSSGLLIYLIIRRKFEQISTHPYGKILIKLGVLSFIGCLLSLINLVFQLF